MKPKPDPEGILLVLNTLHVNANEAIFIGDSDADITCWKTGRCTNDWRTMVPNYQSATFNCATRLFY